MFQRLSILLIILASFGCGLQKPMPAGTFQNLAQAIKNPLAVEVLYLNNQKRKELPTEIRHFKNLKALHLKRNQLRTLPNWLAELPQLNYLDLGRNAFVGFPVMVLEFHQLQHLSLAGNKIGTVPEAIAQLKKLETLDLFDTYIEALPIAALQQLPNLKQIDVRQTLLFKDEIGPYEIALPQVEWLAMPGCDCNTPKRKL
jgi:Leucine-rich repeat (LRR) protein